LGVIDGKGNSDLHRGGGDKKETKEHTQNNFHNVASNLTGFQNLSGLVVEVILCTFLKRQYVSVLRLEIRFLPKIGFL